MKKTKAELRLRREPTERMWRIHEMLSAGVYPNCSGMARKMEVSLRTLKRDLAYMRDHWGLPIEYDVKRNGFHYSKPVHGWPGAAMVLGVAEGFEKPAGCKTDAFPPSAFDILTGKGNYEVVLEFDAWATHRIRGRQWHVTQRVNEMPSGASRFRVRVDSLENLAGWVLSWGTHVQVVRPQALEDELSQLARELARRYGGGENQERVLAE